MEISYSCTEKITLFADQMSLLNYIDAARGKTNFSSISFYTFFTPAGSGREGDREEEGVGVGWGRLSDSESVEILCFHGQVNILLMSR